MLTRAGVEVTLVGREPHVSAMAKGGLRLESLRFDERLPVRATADVAGVVGADAVLVCVKAIDTAQAARALAPHLGPETLVVSLQNGVENVAVMREAAGVVAVPAVVYVAAALAGPGHVKHTGRGDLIVQAPTDAPRRAVLDRLCGAFERAGVPCRAVDDAGPDLWMKLVLNCAFNAISALGRARYGRISADPLARDTLERAVHEAALVAQAAGIALPVADPVAAAWKLAAAMPDALSSTAQDLARGKRTEIDALNGYATRRGQELGVATPVNQALWSLVRLLEDAAAPIAQAPVAPKTARP
jgi:2-dehydropantoate 2-reductase